MRKLILFSTPIGNLGDVSLNFLKKIEEVDVIFAENPSHTLKMLNYYKINKKLLKYHEWDWRKNRDRIVSLINKYEVVGFVSNAGMPNIEDPAVNLVRYSIENNVELEVVGGPSALCLSLSLSPIPYTPFIFVGFLDKKKKFIDYFKKVSTIVKSVVFFESCHRVRKTISLLKSVFSTNFFLILHELTKINQKIIFKKLNEVIEEDIIERGEYTFILYF